MWTCKEWCSEATTLLTDFEVSSTLRRLGGGKPASTERHSVGMGWRHSVTIRMVSLSLVDVDQRYSPYPTPTYPSDSVSVAKNSKDVTGKTKSARNFIYTLIR